MTDDIRQLVERALARDKSAVRDLLQLLTPVVHVRVARALARRKQGRVQGRDARQEVADMVQDVFVALLSEDGKALRAWSPERGMSFLNFVGLLAEHQVASVLRSGRRSPWTEEPSLPEEIDSPALPETAVDVQVASRQLFTALMERMRAELSPLGLRMFYLLIVEEQPVDVICADTGMMPDAVYAWRSRLGKLARKLAAELESEPAMSKDGATRRSASMGGES